MKLLTKPSRDLPSQDAYPQEIQHIYEILADDLTEVHMEYLDDLIDNIYKVAYMDGVKDMVYFHDL